MYSKSNHLLMGLHAGITLRILHMFVERRLIGGLLAVMWLVGQ
jgi:hypothetical protein